MVIDKKCCQAILVEFFNKIICTLKVSGIIYNYFGLLYYCLSKSNFWTITFRAYIDVINS